MSIPIVANSWLIKEQVTIPPGALTPNFRGFFKMDGSLAIEPTSEDPSVYKVSWVTDDGAHCSVTGLTLDTTTNMLSGTDLEIVEEGVSDGLKWDVSVDLVVRVYFHPLINDFPDNGTGVVTAIANAGPPMVYESGARKKSHTKR